MYALRAAATYTIHTTLTSFVAATTATQGKQTVWIKERKKKEDIIFIN